MGTVSFSTQVEGPRTAAPVHINILADTAGEALDMLGTVLDGLIGDVPVRATVSTTEEKAELEEKLEKAAKPEKGNPDPSKAAKRDKDEALALVTNHYTNKELRPKLKALLTEFGVERFSMIPDEAGSEFLRRAKETIG